MNLSNSKTSYLRQVNEVNGGDTIIVRCGSVCLYVCVRAHNGPVNHTSLKRLKLRLQI